MDFSRGEVVAFSFFVGVEAGFWRRFVFNSLVLFVLLVFAAVAPGAGFVAVAVAAGFGGAVFSIAMAGGFGAAVTVVSGTVAVLARSAGVVWSVAFGHCGGGVRSETNELRRGVVLCVG